MRRSSTEKEKEYTARLRTAFPTLLDEFPRKPYLAQLKTRDYYLQYEQFSKKLTTMLDTIEHRYGIGAVALYQKSSLCCLIVESASSLDKRRLPEGVRDSYTTWFERIYADFSDQADAYYDYKKLFWPVRKDLAVCSGRAIPVGGAWLVERRRLSRSALTKRSAAGAESSSSSGAVRGGGRARVVAAGKALGLGEVAKKVMRAVRELRHDYEWFYVIHTAERNIQDFNRAQMALAYRNIVELLELDPDVWGVFRQSWFLDPSLKEISPDLSFLWEVPQRHGAELYCAGACTQGEIAKITATSPIRKRLYEEERYIPKNYFYLWPRDKMVEMKEGDL